MDAAILVVDDDDAVRRLCARFLSNAGCKVTEAATGEQAAALLKTPLDIVLTDLRMPGDVDGNELTRRVKAGSAADVIIMTGNPALETAVRALRDGAYDYLIKPFSQETLLHTVRRCLDKRGFSKELALEKALRAELHGAYTELSTMTALRETFGQFVTPEVASFVLANPGSLSREGEQKSCTVLFADVRGFTSFSTLVPPRQAVSALNEIFTRFIQAVEAEGGILNKFMGDGVMALFGTPARLENHAAAGAKAALGAMRAIEALASARQAGGLTALRVGMGLNTGMMIAGCLGTPRRREYSVIGSAVNLASRLESAAKAGQILAGPETAALLAADFELRDQGAFALKGFAEAVRAGEILGPRPPRAAARADGLKASVWNAAEARP